MPETKKTEAAKSVAATKTPVATTAAKESWSLQQTLLLLSQRPRLL